MKVADDYFLGMVDALNLRKKYIIEHKNSDGTLIITNRELAKRCGVGINTVTDTLKLLREKNLIEAKIGAIILPSGNKKQEA